MPSGCGEDVCIYKVVVMDQGVSVQIGTPREIYFHPQNAYVSSFVGKSNYIEEDGKTQVIRPEDIILHPKANGAYKITAVQFMGAHTEYRLTSPKGNLIANLSGYQNSHYEIGNQVDVEFIHAFCLSD